MKEVQITCLTRSLRIEDLGLSLKKGDVVTIPHAVAWASSDLAFALRTKAASMLLVFKSKETRPEEPPAKKQRHPMRIPTGEVAPPVLVRVKSPEILADMEGIVEQMVSLVEAEPPKKKPGRKPRR